MKDPPQMAQISYNICFHQTHVHYLQYLLTYHIYVFVTVFIIRRINVDCVSFLHTPIHNNKDHDNNDEQDCSDILPFYLHMVHDFLYTTRK